MVPPKFKTLHRNSIFVVENHLSLTKCLPPNSSVKFPPSLLRIAISILQLDHAVLSYQTSNLKNGCTNMHGGFLLRQPVVYINNYDELYLRLC